MEKLSINIDPEQWGNLITKYQAHSPRLKETDFSDGTINLATDINGSLMKHPGSVNYNAALLPAAPKDQYEAIFSDGARHLLVVTNGTFYYSTGDTLFNAVTNGSGFSAGANFEFATMQDRVYGGNRVNAPIVYDRIAAYGGAAPVTVPRIKTMGAQAPSTAPTVAVAAGGAVPTATSHTYKITFVYYDSEESNGGPASTPAVTTPGNQTVNLTAIPLGGYGVSQRGIYRDNNDGNWVLLTYITNNTATTYSDVLATGVTPTPIPTNNGVPPTFGLITLWLDRLWLSQVPGDPYTLFYSEAGQPDIYGSENQILCNQEDPITATIVYFDRLMVFNRRSFGQIVGSTPDSFRYAAIPSSVGCVDNRTLQTHVLQGVPVLIWLSERGFYTYDGNAIDYVSDPIEDLVNYNIRQAIQQKNANSQTSFVGGTPSDGIDIPTLASSITTRGYYEGSPNVGNNPRRDWDTTGDWEASGTVNTNTATQDGTSTVKVPTRFAPVASEGQLSGSAQLVGNSLELPTVVGFTGESNVNTGSGDFVVWTRLAVSIVPLDSGVVTAFQIQQEGLDAVPTSKRIFSDVGGSPGVDLGPITYHLTAGTTYWLVNYYTPSGVPNNIRKGTAYLSGAGAKYFNGSWISTSHPIKATYSFNHDPYSKSGAWESSPYDSTSLSIAVGLNIQVQASNLSAERTATLVLQGSDDNAVFGLTESFSLTNGVNNFAPLGANKRYWKILLQLGTADDRDTPRVDLTLGSTFLTFNTTATWESDVIDTTSDSTVYNFLTSSTTVPVGTSATITIATSANIAGPWSGVGNADGQFGPFGSHIVRQYAKIRVVLVTTTDNVTSPTLSSIYFGWTVVSNFLSPVIDTGVAPPAGWDVFLAQFTANGGTVQFQMRSGSTNDATPGTGVLDPANVFTNVTPAEFPTLTAFQFVQWKVILTSFDLAVPIVDSVTVQWLIGLSASVRPASIFVDGRYYVALTELEQTVNSLVLQLDLNSKWRRLANLSIATLSFFFNRPYLGMATNGQIRKFLEGVTNAGTAIEFDVRTKAFDFSTAYREVSEKQKIVGEVIVHLSNTGAAVQMMYSVDEGENFYPLYTLNGATSYQTAASGPDVFVRFKPSWTNGNPINGQHLMYRIYSNDLFNVEVHSLKVQAMVRTQPPVITG